MCKALRQDHDSQSHGSCSPVGLRLRCGEEKGVAQDIETVLVMIAIATVLNASTSHFDLVKRGVKIYLRFDETLDFRM